METQSEAQEPPAPAGAAFPTRPAPHPGYLPETLLHDYFGKAVLAVALLFALAIVAALVFVHCFFSLLRRHSRRFGPLIRIEYAGGLPMAVGPYAAGSLGAAGPEQEAGSARAGAGTATHLDLGPTFEDLRHLKQEQGKRQEEAVLQHLFEDNLKLHEQIGLGQAKRHQAAKEPNG